MPKAKSSLLIPTAADVAALAPTQQPRRTLGAKWSMLAEAKDPDDFKAIVAREVGDISKVHVFSGRVLVAIYIASRTYKVGNTSLELVRTDNDVREDLWQGTVGLVLKKGATAFQDDGETKFHGQDVAVGDWVTFRRGDAKRIQINGVDCLFVEDTVIDMAIADPTLITQFQSRG